MTPLDALQTSLAGEHAALHVYGALGAKTSASATPGLYAELGGDLPRAPRPARRPDRGSAAGRVASRWRPRRPTSSPSRWTRPRP